MRFRLSDESKNPKSHQWLFDDGNVSFDDAPVHQYKEPNTYSPQLIIDYNDSNCADTFTVNLTLDTLPQADFSFKTEDCLAHF